MMVQAMVIYYGSLQVLGIDMDPIFAGILVVSINTGAYMAEIIREELSPSMQAKRKRLIPLG